MFQWRSDRRHELFCTIFVVFEHIETRATRRKEDDITFHRMFRHIGDSLIHIRDSDSGYVGLMRGLEKDLFCFTENSTLRTVFFEFFTQSEKRITLIFTTCDERDATRSESFEGSEQ